MFKKNLFFYILVISIFTSCAKTQDEDSTLTNYQVSQVQVIDYKEINSNKSKTLSEVKDSAHYSLKVCFKDVAVGRPVIDQSFSVEIDNKQVTKTTDFEGCINWYGQVPHSTLSCEKVTTKNIRITGNDQYVGETTFPLHFNPSAKSTSAFSDGRYITPQFSDNLNCEPTKFNVDNVTLVRKGTQSNIVEFVAEISPSLIRQSMDMQSYSVKLENEGSFDIAANLIANQDGELILIDTYSTTASITNRDLRANLEFSMPQVDFKSHNTEYMIELSVNPKGIEDLEGYTGIMTSNDLFFSKSTSIKKTSQKIESLSLKEITSDKLQRTNTVQVRAITLLSVEQVNDDNYSQNKKKKFSIETCFYNNFSQYGSEPATSVGVEVTSHNELEIAQVGTTTDEFGCVYYNMYTDYKLFGKRTWTNDTLIFKVSQGEKQEVINRPIAINPWLESSAIRDLKKSNITKETIERGDSQLFIKSIRYEQKGSVSNSYYVNKYSQLFFKKRYELEFDAMVDLTSTFSQSSTPQILNFGELKVNTYMLTPNHSEVDVRKTDFDEMTLVSATTNIRKIGKTGKVTIYPELPLEVSDSLFLASKAILVVELIPGKGLEGLESRKFAIEFNALASLDEKSAFEVTNQLSSDQQELAWNMIDDTHAFRKGLASKLTNTNSLELFQQHLEKTIGNFEKLSVSQFISRPVVKEAKLSALNMRTLFNVKAKVPKSGGYQSKLCQIAYPDTLDYLSRRSCEDSFSDHIKVIAGEHMIDVYAYDKYSKNHGVSKATITPGSEVNGGKISLGKAYMAAKGTRAAQQWGTGNTFSASTSLSMYYDGPPSVIFATKGFTWSKEEFDQSVNAKMQMEFTRTYSNLNEADLNYEKIELSFDALTKKCVLILKLKDKKSNMQICEDNAHERPVRDNWYFIGEVDSNKHGVITDGVKVGERSYQRVIRGESNFKQVWKVFERDNVKQITETMQDFYLGETFLKYKKEGKVNIDYEIYKDNSFPGLIKRR